MKNLKLSVTLLIILFGTGLFYGIYRYNQTPNNNLNNINQYSSDYTTDLESNSLSNSINNVFHRNTNMINYNNLVFTPWDVKTASENIIAPSKKPYTIMVYMNGSDLESEEGAATIDLIEMLESEVNTDYVNIIIFTGGTNRWQNNLIPSNDCVIWEIIDNQIYKLTSVGLLNMGNPGTLSGFIDFSINNFPAEKYGLIMWDHGGGAIAGYGKDENFNNSNLTLLDMNLAFEKSMLSENKLEFLGFDTCLMATIEMAVIASDYAKYLIASEDLEPGDGWNYHFLKELNNNPYMDGATLGKLIVDYFMDFYDYSPNSLDYYDLTLSVSDLSSVSEIMGAMGNLMKLTSESLISNQANAFRAFAWRRNATKTFGEGSPRDNDTDMVDIGDMAIKLLDLYPNESRNILNQLDNAIIYNRHNSDVDIKGLSSYYVYGGKNISNMSLDVYSELLMSYEYTRYLHYFNSILSNPNIVRRTISANNENIPFAEDLISQDITLWHLINENPKKLIMIGLQEGLYTNSDDEDINVVIDGLWPMINGNNVCLYKIGGSENRLLYAVPANINGTDCDIVILKSDKYPHGKILGKRQEDGIIKQKGFDEINDGDKISIYYQEIANTQSNQNINWYSSDTFTVNGELKLEWATLDKNEIFYSLRLTDIIDNKYFTNLIKIQ